MLPFAPRTKKVMVPPTGAAAGAAESTPPRLVHPEVTCGSPEAGSGVEFSQSALSRPRQATVSVNGPLCGVPVMTAAGAPTHDAVPPSSCCQPAVSDRTYRCVSVPVAMNTGCTG